MAASARDASRSPRPAECPPVTIGAVRHKALENLRAAQALTVGDALCPNAAVSRAYYAAYHACWHRLEELGEEVPDDKGYWPHHEFPTYALRAGAVDEDQSEFIEHLYSKRLTADYYPEDIQPDEAIELTGRVKEFFARLEVRKG